ncbi:uncharacterized protein [Onthophagus taurus]|uniref:uncharacterized protein n=1 Tax=Onthophagus taurus TaxID=166361 RepID=UPI0039BDFDF9
MQLTPSVYSAGFIAIYLLNVIYTTPLDEMKKRHLQTESFGILELDLDESMVQQIYEDKLLSKLKDIDEETARNYTKNNNTGSNVQTRLVTFGQQTNVNNQVANLLNHQISNQITNELINAVSAQIPLNQDDMAVVSVAIPQATLQRTVGNVIANQLFINRNQNNLDQSSNNHKQVEQNNEEQNNLDSPQKFHPVKSSLHHDYSNQKQLKHPDLDRIKFSVPNSVPIVIKLKDKMVVNRKVKKIHKRKNGVNEDIHIIW